MGQDYAEQICQAIDQIVTKKIEAINYDQTFSVTIIDITEASHGKYRVSDGSVEYYAYSMDTSYKVNDRVYVTVPNGDFSQQKIIVGKVVNVEDGVDYNYVRPFNTIVDISGNLLKGNSDNYACSLLANYPADLNAADKYIPDRQVNGQTVSYNVLENNPYYQGIKIWEADLSDQPLTGYTRLGIKAQFKSHLAQLNCVSGNYGLQLVTRFKRSASVSESNIYYQGKNKILELVSDMPEALYNTYCEYHGLITENQTTTINTESDYKVLLNKMTDIYRQDYVWLMSHSEELGLTDVSNIYAWNQYDQFHSFLDNLNTLQLNYINALTTDINNQTTLNTILNTSIKTNANLVDIYLDFLNKRKIIYETYKRLINVNISDGFADTINKEYMVQVATAIKSTINEFSDLLRTILFNTLEEKIAEKESQSETIYVMNLDTYQMIGDPYGLETYIEQEAVFPIDGYGQLVKAELYFYQTIGEYVDENTGKTINLNFRDKNGNDIPYYDNVDILGSIANTVLLNNLFEKDPYICIGYSLEDFDKEHVQLYTFSPLTYSADSAVDNGSNEKTIHLRWVHKDEDGKNSIVDKDTTFESDDGIAHYPDIRWYRYKLGAPSPDQYAGVSWERINEIEVYEETETEVINISESVPMLTERLKTFYLVYHTTPTGGTAFEGTYSQNFQPEYKEEYPKTRHIGEGLKTSSNYSYTGFWTDACREKYHLSEDIASHAFVGMATTSITKYAWQSWEDIFLSGFIYHNNPHPSKFEDHYSEYYTGTELKWNDVHNGYQGYGCLHPVGFWEKFTMAYRLYWVYPNEFRSLRVSNLFTTGGPIIGTDWDLYRNKNIYTDLSYTYDRTTNSTTVYPNPNWDKFKIDTGAQMRPLFTAFANSFGEWGYVEDEYGMRDYRPLDDEVYQQLYDATLYFFQKIDDPTYNGTETHTHTYTKIPDYFHYTFIPDFNRSEEKFKVIVNCLDDIYESNELIFTNENMVANPISTDQAQGLYLWCADNTYGNYFIYQMNSLLIDDKQASKIRTLEARFNNFAKLETESDLVTQAESITWKIPYQNTMIIPYGIDIENKCKKDGMYLDADIDVNDDGYVYITRKGRSDEGFKIDPTIQYTIARSHTQINRNNFIQCILELNGNSYVAIKEFTFGTMGTSGSDYTLVLDMDDNELALEADSCKPSILNITARVYDSNGADITEQALATGNWEWFWHEDSCGIDFDLNKIYLDCGFDRSVRVAADLYDFDPVTGIYYTIAKDASIDNYLNYYYQKSTDNGYVYAPASELLTYDPNVGYWIQNSMYEKVSPINANNYTNYFVKSGINYIPATDANGSVYYEIVAATPVTKDNFSKYLICTGDNVYTTPDKYTSSRDFIYYERHEADVAITATNYEQYYVHDTNVQYIPATEYIPGQTYYEVRVESGITSANYKQYYLRFPGTNEYYKPLDEMAFSNSETYYSVREKTGVTAASVENYYIKKQLDQYSKFPIYMQGIRYYQIIPAKAVNAMNFKARVNSGLYKFENNAYTQVTINDTFSNETNYYFIANASGINEGNFKHYFIERNGSYETPTVYDENAVYYKLTNQVNELVSSKKVGTNVASISCVGDISLNNFLILGCTLSNWGNYPLTTYLPIPIREVDEFKYINLTLNPEEVKENIEQYTIANKSYTEFIDFYNAQLAEQKSQSNSSLTSNDVTVLQDQANLFIKQAKQTEETKLFKRNVFSSLEIGASKFAVPVETIIEEQVEEPTNAGNYVYTAKKFCDILIRLADDENTIYNNTAGMNLGIWTPTNTPPHYGYYSFDCWNLVKSIIWGFNFSKYGALGGGVYQSHGLPDTDGWSICQMSYDLIQGFADLATMKSGEFLYKPGHAGVYIGDRPGHEGKWAIECTNLGYNKVQWSEIDTAGNRTFDNGRTGSNWTHHCKLPWINYATTTNTVITTTIDNSQSGFEDALKEWDRLIKELKSADTVEDIRATLEELDNTFSSKTRLNTKFEETSSSILGTNTLTNIEKYYDNTIALKNELNKIYNKYYKELVETEDVFLNTTSENKKAMATAHLYGGYALDLNKINTITSAKFKAFIQQHYVGFYIPLDNDDTTNNEVINFFNTKTIDLYNQLAAIEPILLQHNSPANKHYDNEAVAATGSTWTNERLQAKIEEYNLLSIEYDYLNNANNMMQLISLFGKPLTNLLDLFVKEVNKQVLEIDTTQISMVSLSYIQALNNTNGWLQVCNILESNLINYYNAVLDLIEQKITIIQDIKDIYSELGQALIDERKYKELKAVYEDALSSIEAFYKTKHEITETQYKERKENYEQQLKTLNKKLLKTQKIINKSLEELQNIVNTNEISVDIAQDDIYEKLLKDYIKDYTNKQNEIITLLNEQSVLLDSYESNENTLAYIKRKYGYIVGPTVIIYPSSGESYNLTTNRNEPYQMFMFPEGVAEQSEGYWRIYNPHQEDNGYIGHFEECKSEGGLGCFSGLPYSNILEPAAVFSATAHQYGVQYVEVNVKDYAIPLLNHKTGEWEMYILPGWNDDGDKLGLRSLLIKEWNPHVPFEQQNDNVTILRRAILDNSRIVWTQPIYTYQNLYPSGTVNAWNGSQLELGDNYVLAAFMAAGKKNQDNTFSGVMFGDYSQDPKGAEWSLAGQTGVYGFNHGAMSYAFKEDGTAFIGPAGKGRIQFDGNKGIIASAGYVGTVGLKSDIQFDGLQGVISSNSTTENQCGMMIDLDDSIIDMRGTLEQTSIVDDFMVHSYSATGSQVLIQAKDPYLKVVTENNGITNGNTILNVGVNNYYLQSDNYNRETNQGTRIDLATGDMVLAGNITWSGRWEDCQVQCLYSSGKAEEAYIVDDTLVQNNTIPVDRNHYTATKVDNKWQYTQCVVGSGNYLPGVIYYKKQANTYHYTPPESPDTKTSDSWWGKVDIVTNGYNNPIMNVSSWPYKGVLLETLNNNVNNYHPIWHKKRHTGGTEKEGKYVKDNYVSYSYNQGQTWSSPEKIDGYINDSNLIASLLNSVNNDGIYNNGGSIGIRAAAIRTGLLYSRDANLASSDNTFAKIAKKVGCVIDLDQGYFSLKGHTSGTYFFITPDGLETVYGTNHTFQVNNTTANWVLYSGGKFGVDINGNLYATNATISGNISSTTGDIAGWTINDGTLTSFGVYTSSPVSQTKINGRYTVSNSNATYPGNVWAEISNLSDGYFLRSSYIDETSKKWVYPFYVTNTGELHASNADIKGTIRVESLYINNNLVTPKEVTIPVAFKVEARVGDYITGTDTKTVTAEKNLYQYLRDEGHTFQSVIMLADGAAMGKLFATYFAGDEYWTTLPSYTYHQYTPEDLAVLAKNNITLGCYLETYGGTPVLNWNYIKWLSLGSLISFEDVNSTEVISLEASYEVPTYVTNHVYGYDAYVSKVLKATVYTNGDNDTVSGLQHYLNPSGDNEYGLKQQTTSTGTEWVPTKDFTLFTTGDVKTIDDVYIDGEIGMNDYAYDTH